MFLLRVDDLNPIEAGLLADGTPDLYFRGVYGWNSEVAPRRLTVAELLTVDGRVR